MNYIYIDESGDTGYTKKSTKYFIITAVMVDNPFILSRIAKSVYKSKVSKKKGSMLHAHKETDRVKKQLIRELKNIDVKCMIFYINKHDLYNKDPYLYLLNKLVKLLKDVKTHEIIIASRDTRNNYNKNLINLFKINGFKLRLSNPNSEKSLQIADFYSFTVFSYLEHCEQRWFDEISHDITLIK